MQPFLTLPRIRFHRQEQDQREGQEWWKSSQDWRGVLRSGRFPISLGKSREVQGDWGIALSLAHSGDFLREDNHEILLTLVLTPKLSYRQSFPVEKQEVQLNSSPGEDFPIISLFANLTNSTSFMMKFRDVRLLILKFILIFRLSRAYWHIYMWLLLKNERY